MSIELAYIAEKVTAIMRSLDEEFFAPKLAEARERKAKKQGETRKKAAIAGTRIIAFSPLLGKEPALQQAIQQVKDALETVKGFQDGSHRALATTFLHVYRAFLLSLASVSESGVEANDDLFAAFQGLFSNCMGKGAPKTIAKEAKKSWADFLQATSSDSKDDAASCSDRLAKLETLMKALQESIAGLDDVLRADADNMVSAAENLVEACKSCIFIAGKGGAS